MIDILVTKSSSFAVEALAGLASTEDFSTVTLRNVSETSVSTNKLQPYKDIMLILIKGRRHVQARLVEPVAESVNNGDSYILVTKSEVIISMIIISRIELVYPLVNLKHTFTLILRYSIFFINHK